MPDASRHQLNSQLLEFIESSPTPWHAVRSLARTLDATGFAPLDEAADWSGLAARGKRWYVRRGGSLIAFQLGNRPLVGDGIRMIGAHTDSPCLRVKPNPDLYRHGYLQAGVEVYGGALLAPWFDRDLSLAGQVTLRNPDGNGLTNHLLDFRRPIAVIPSLAIHLDREANDKRSINRQTDITPLLLQHDRSDPDNQGDHRGNTRPTLADLLCKQLSTDLGRPVGTDELLNYELCFYDTQRPAIIGADDQFIAAARLDNLLSCFVGLRALIDGATPDHACLLVCNDHEEVGSTSASGATGPFLKTVLQRLLPDTEALAQTLHRSFLISADNAHGIHPNFPARHDANHGPLLNHGPVIKINANQRYATNSTSAALFRALCDATATPHQTFVNRTDLACGSTIGPLTSAEVGVTTLDVGIATFAMHSIRELAGAADPAHLHRVLAAFCAHPEPLDPPAW